MNKQHRHATRTYKWTYSTDKQYGQATLTCSMDMQRTVDMQHRDMDMQHGRAAELWTQSMDSMDIKHTEHGHEAWT